MRRADWSTRGILCFVTACLVSFTPSLAAQPVAGRPGRADSKATVAYFEIERLATPQRPMLKESGDKAGEYMPLNRPLPPGAVLGRELFPRRAPSQAQAVLVSPPPAASFAALGDNNTVIPPDVHGAAGPNHLMVTLNSQVRIQNRTGGVISTVTLNSFWSSTGATGVFDPKILYDPFANRWMFTAVSNSRSAASSVLMGVSQTSDPTGVWNLYRVDADPANVAWADYPSFGFNKNWIVVQINLFAVADNAFIRSNIYAFNKADLYAGGAGLFTLFFDTTGGFSQTPAITHDTALSTMYMLEDWNGNSGGSGFLRLSTITGAVGSETYTPGVVFPSVADPWEDIGSTGFADFAPQLGSTQKIMNNDARMQNTVYRNGSLWCTHTVFLPAGSGTHSSVQWWKLTPAGSILDRGRINDPAGNLFYAFPSIAVNKNNDALLGFSRFSASQFAGGNYAYRAASDPAGTFRTDTVLKAGEAFYFKTFGGGRNRWGDFSGTVMDPVNDLDFWTIQEYAAAQVAGSSRWGTWWGKIVPPAVSPCLLDSIKPSISCPANVVKSNDFGQCSAAALFSATATDNCPGVSVTCTPPSGSTFPVGITNVICVAADSAGNKDSCTFSVTVTDTSKPAVACPANVVTGNDPGQCGAAVAFAASASDNCPGTALVCTPPSGSTFPVGVTNVKCVATDAAGNKDSCLFSVTVNDTTKPVAACPGNIAAANDPGRCSAAVGFSASASDNCPGVSMVCTPPSGSTFPVGASNVKCIATDAAGNKDSCTFSVNVADTSRPAVACPANIVISSDPGRCGAVASFSANVSDNCPGATLVCLPASGSIFAVGVTSVKCTATDAAGNKDSCLFSVTVADTAGPVLSCPSNFAVGNDPGQCGAVVSYAVSAADNCPGAGFACSPPSGSTFALGATLVNCAATDAAGNRDSCSFSVTVNDVEKPAISCPANITAFRSAAQCDSVTVAFSASASDNCSGVLLVCNPPSGSGFPLGTTAVTCVATDAGGNGDTCTFMVTVYKGDMDGSGNLTSADAVLMLNCVFLGVGTCSPCFADLNCDGALTSSDVILELNAVFLGLLVSCSP